MKKGAVIAVGAGVLVLGGAAAFFLTRKPGTAGSATEENPRLDPTGQPGTKRGERNNNPCNVTPLPNGQLWDGQTGVDSGGDTPYCIFSSPIKGIRAAGVNALNYYSIHHLTTLRAIGDRWGPAASDHYGEDLAHTIGIDADAFFNVPANLESLLKAISVNENSEVPYSESDWQAGVNQALAAKGFT